MNDWEGTVAGVGDLIQARKIAWDLTGFEGNAAAPINRKTYRVIGLRPDGGLTVAPILGRATEAADAEAERSHGQWDEQLGDRCSRRSIDSSPP